MRTVPRAAFVGVLAFVVMAGTAPWVAGQQTATVARPALTDEQMEQFLLNAKIIATKGVSKGITDTRRATLSDGQITHDAQIQTVDISKTVFTPDRGQPEINFRDTYKYNIAGYRIARLLGLDNVPVSVERSVQGTHAAVTWWVDDVYMDEADRVKKPKPTPDWVATKTASQTHILRVFDELIANNDRNLGNLLWTGPGKMWMIDHTRAFRLRTSLKAPQLLERCESRLLENMRKLTADSIQAAVGGTLTKYEIESVLGRRDQIVKLFEDKIAERGLARVLYTFDPF
jgi:hypothetical protein